MTLPCSHLVGSCLFPRISDCSRHVHGASGRREELTRVDQFLLRNLPALLCLDLGLELADLVYVLAGGRDIFDVWRAVHRFRRLGLDDELVLLEILGPY
jgi:hypothetical protein